MCVCVCVRLRKTRKHTSPILYHSNHSPSSTCFTGEIILPASCVCNKSWCSAWEAEIHVHCFRRPLSVWAFLTERISVSDLHSSHAELFLLKGLILDVNRKGTCYHKEEKIPHKLQGSFICGLYLKVLKTNLTGICENWTMPLNNSSLFLLFLQVNSVFIFHLGCSKCLLLTLLLYSSRVGADMCFIYKTVFYLGDGFWPQKNQTKTKPKPKQKQKNPPN